MTILYLCVLIFINIANIYSKVVNWRQTSDGYRVDCCITILFWCLITHLCDVLQYFQCECWDPSWSEVTITIIIRVVVLGQVWFGQWLGVCQYQAIARANVYLSLAFKILTEILKPTSSPYNLLWKYFKIKFLNSISPDKRGSYCLTIHVVDNING